MRKKLKNILEEKEIHWPVLILSLLITCVLSRLVFLDIHKQAETKFNSQIYRVESALGAKLSAYEQILLGGAGLYEVMGEVSRNQWRKYIESISLNKNYPGLRGVGYGKRVLKDDVPNHIKKIQEQGLSYYNIFPNGDRSEYYPVIFMEPFNVENQKVLGFDMATNKDRLMAMEIARDTGTTTLSNRVKLLPNENGIIEDGFVMFLPIYNNTKPHETINDKRENIIGFIYSPFSINIFINKTISPMHLMTGMKLYEGSSIEPDKLIYQTEGTKDETVATFSKIKRYASYGKRYTIQYYTLPEFDTDVQHSKWIFVLLLGSLLSLIFFMLIRSLVTINLTAARLAAEMTHELRKNKEDLENLAHFDSLTGLANRFFFNKTLSHAISLANRHDYKIALLFIDLDGFKLVNDNYGHEAGDIVLKEVSKRIKECLREVDTVGRLGGDEFVVLIEKETRIESISTVATNIIEAINKPIKINEKEVGVGISMGIAICPDSGNDIGSLMKNADHAMYKIKQSGKNNFALAHEM